MAALFLCPMTAFYFAKFRFPGRKGLFAFILMTMMIPSQLLMIPQLIMMGRLGLVSSLWALILPSLVPAFGIFWMRQYRVGAIHDDLIHAGRIDGCGAFRLLYNKS
ncbi:MAG TPA: carbohydrate ABC transporter permease [Candidatus Limiplasma pullistercoris]|nr:carbohydrate ABC transporter permease [Candidatus Limiplasma pullistercoris]